MGASRMQALIAPAPARGLSPRTCSPAPPPIRRAQRPAQDNRAPSASPASLAGRQYVAKGERSCDLVVIIARTTDRTDVDLHLTDASGEECFYEHRDTKLGRHITEVRRRLKGRPRWTSHAYRNSWPTASSSTVTCKSTDVIETFAWPAASRTRATDHCGRGRRPNGRHRTTRQAGDNPPRTRWRGHVCPARRSRGSKAGLRLLVPILTTNSPSSGSCHDPRY
jgi:hypothetical protein